MWVTTASNVPAGFHAWHCCSVTDWLDGSIKKICTGFMHLLARGSNPQWKGLRWELQCFFCNMWILCSCCFFFFFFSFFMHLPWTKQDWRQPRASARCQILEPLHWQRTRGQVYQQQHQNETQNKRVKTKGTQCGLSLSVRLSLTSWSIQAEDRDNFKTH